MKSYRPAIYRVIHPAKRFTPDEDVKMQELRIEGATLATVAAALSRPRSSIQVRLEHLACLPERARCRWAHYRPRYGAALPD